MDKKCYCVLLRLTGVTLRPPQFEIRWKYVDVMLGSGLVHEKKRASSSGQSIFLRPKMIAEFFYYYCVPLILYVSLSIHLWILDNGPYIY